MRDTIPSFLPHQSTFPLPHASTTFYSQWRGEKMWGVFIMRWSHNLSVFILDFFFFFFHCSPSIDHSQWNWKILNNQWVLLLKHTHENSTESAVIGRYKKFYLSPLLYIQFVGKNEALSLAVSVEVSYVTHASSVQPSWGEFLKIILTVYSNRKGSGRMYFREEFWELIIWLMEHWYAKLMKWKAGKLLSYLDRLIMWMGWGTCLAQSTAPVITPLVPISPVICLPPICFRGVISQSN